MIPWFPGIQHISPSDLAALEKAADSAGLPASDLAAHISQESGFNPRVRVGKNSGLIMMADDTSRAFNGGRLADSLSFKEQLPGIIRYFSIGEPISGADFRLLGIRRGEAGKPRLIHVADPYVIFPVASPGWKANPSLRSPGNGPITAGSVRRRWEAFVDTFAGNPQPTPWADSIWERFPAGRKGGGLLALGALGAFGYWLSQRV